MNDVLAFWLEMLPALTEQIQNIEQNPVVRTMCCDAMGDVGVHVYEKLPVSIWMILLDISSYLCAIFVFFNSVNARLLYSHY